MVWSILMEKSTVEISLMPSNYMATILSKKNLPKSNASEPKLTAQGNLKGKNMALKSSPSKTELIIPQPMETGELAAIANASLSHNKPEKCSWNCKS